MLRPSLPRKCKATRSPGLSVANVPASTPKKPTNPKKSSNPKKPANPKHPKSHSRRTQPAKRAVSYSTKKTQNHATMPEQPSVPRPAAAASPADGAGAIPMEKSPIKKTQRPALTPGQPLVLQPDAAPRTTDGEGDIVMDQQEYNELLRGQGPVRRLTKARYEEMVQHRLTSCFHGMLAFHNVLHWDAVDTGFEAFQGHLLQVALDMTETVDWGTLDSETQESLKAWAPKAKEYLETPEGAKVMFEAWLWRILVDGVFNGPGDQPHWKPYIELQRIIEPLADLSPDALRSDQKETNFLEPLWRPIVADRLKMRPLLWRALTVELLRSARGETSRYAVESVVGLLREKLGRWLQPVKDGQHRWPTMDRDVNQLAAKAVEVDWYLHRIHTRWEFGFTDPETGSAHGFLYKKGNETRIEPHYISSDSRYQEGYPVDLVVSPSFSVWGDYTHPIGDWGAPGFRKPMVVAIDMLPNEDGEAGEAA
ncbi:hypothetical protein C8A00DRAFT_34561 [Chaetomidium leptoderma]|uniref:Uncharacterized protein n=1 Tax=Chaetomidium leptoderma TaxID=669021 RepID=A0AAN6VKY3_9PEZI|nr:hypothetical protein C8A00DRAFT_34561 [Chaetomidium leptoderma]